MTSFSLCSSNCSLPLLFIRWRGKIELAEEAGVVFRDASVILTHGGKRELRGTSREVSMVFV